MSKKKLTAMQWFEESNSDWQEVGICVLNATELKSVISCSITMYNGDYGVFGKLYLDVKIKGKTLHLMGDEDTDGKRHRGVKLDITSIKRFEYLVDEANHSMDIEPERVILMALENTDDGRVIRRIRITED